MVFGRLVGRKRAVRGALKLLKRSARLLRGLVAQRGVRSDRVVVVAPAAEGLADDRLELEDTPDGARFIVSSAVKASGAAEPLIQRLNKSNEGHGRARRTFGRAWAAMRARAQGEAETRLRGEFDHISATSAALRKFVNGLPQALRNQFVETLGVVTKKVIGLEIGLSRRGILDSESARP